MTQSKKISVCSFCKDQVSQDEVANHLQHCASVPKDRKGKERVVDGIEEIEVEEADTNDQQI